MRRAVLGGAAAVLVVSALLAPVAAAPSAASWQDAAFSRARLDVVPGDCSAPGVFEASASAALLAGTVQGVPVGDAALAPVATGARTSPAAVARTVVADAVASSPVVGGVAPLVRPAPLGAWAQSAATTGTGASSAAAGAGGAIGALDVSGLLDRAPAAALLPGLSGVALDVGRAEAVAALDGCAAAFGASAPVTRTSTAVVGLRATDSAASAALTAMRTSGSGVAAALAAKGDAAAAPLRDASSAALLLAVQQALAVLGVAGASVAVSSGAASVTVAPEGIAAAGTGVQRAGTATIDPAGGLTADLTAAAAAGPDADVVSARSAAAAATAAGDALQQRAAALTAAEAAARDGAAVRVRSAVDVSLTVGLVTARVATVALETTASAASWSDGTAPVPGVTVGVLGGAPIVGLTAAVDARLGPLLTAAVQQAVRDEYLRPATAVIEQATTSTTASVLTARAGLAAHLAALPGVLAVTADLRPRTAADAWTGTDAPGLHQLTALRVRVRTPDGVRADLFLGNAAVGPARAAFR